MQQRKAIERCDCCGGDVAPPIERCRRTQQAYPDSVSNPPCTIPHTLPAHAQHPERHQGARPRGLRRAARAARGRLGRAQRHRRRRGRRCGGVGGGRARAAAAAGRSFGVRAAARTRGAACLRWRRRRCRRRRQRHRRRRRRQRQWRWRWRRQQWWWWCGWRRGRRGVAGGAGRAPAGDRPRRRDGLRRAAGARKGPRRGGRAEPRAVLPAARRGCAVAGESGDNEIMAAGLSPSQSPLCT